jgi:anaerobic ribonucleoside-triphosphate reductase activating protein
MLLRVAQFIAETEAEGPGRRAAVWVQGCSLRCEGCCNPEMFAPDRGGDLLEPSEIARRIVVRESVEGVSILGGEPFQQAPAVAELCRVVRASGRSVMVYSGYTLEELREDPSPGVMDLLLEIDVLVDGRYDRTKPETSRRWLGSSNQRIHFLTNRYTRDDSRFSAPNTIELRLVDGQLTVNGWPGTSDAVKRK